MTIEELNQKAGRLVELHKERRKVKNCRRRMFEQIFGSVYSRDDAYDMYIQDWEYPQDNEINNLDHEISVGLQDLGFSKIIAQALDIERYSNMFCVDYVPYNSKYELLFIEEES